MSESEIKKKKLTKENQRKYAKSLKLFVRSTGIDVGNTSLTKELNENETFASKASNFATKMLENVISESGINKEEAALGMLDLFKSFEDKYIDSKPAKNVANMLLLAGMKKYLDSKGG